MAVLGIEVDGEAVTGVLLLDGHVEAILDGQGESASAKVKSLVRQAGKAALVRVSLPAPGAAARPMTVTAQMSNRAHFERAAFNRTHAHAATATVAGLFDISQLTDGIAAPGIAVAAPRDLVEGVYADLSDPAAQVVAPVACSHRVEGLTLALRRETAELTLVLGGRVIGSQQLAVRSLGELDHTLGQGNVVGATRLGAALRAPAADHARVDAEAVSELDRYLRAVAAQVRDIATTWALEGHDVPQRVYAHGWGATASELTPALAATGMVKHNAANLEAALSSVAPAERTRAVGAYLAALTYDTGAANDAFPNPTAVAVARARRRAENTKRTRRTIGLCVSLLAAGLAAPSAVAVVTNLQHASDVDAAVAATAQELGSDDNAVRHALALVGATHTAVDTDALTALTAALESSATIAALDATATSITVSLSNVQNPADVLAALEQAGLAVTSSEARNDDTLTATISTGSAQ